MIVNVCPAAVTSASPEKIWSLLTSPERYGDWLDARYVSADPPGPLKPGQVILLSTPELGREWPVRIDVRDMDPQQRWLEMIIHLPFGVVNHERITLTDTKRGTLVRFN